MRPALDDRRLALAVVAFGVFVAADDLLVVSTMLRPMIDDLGLVLPRGIDDAAWIVNVYLIAYVAVMPLAGRLSDVFGRRSVFVGALAVFLAGSVVVPLAESLEVMLAGRALTAIGGGALVPVGMAVVGDVYREPARARALGLLAGVGTLGGVWGPLYGALLVRFLTWEWQFWLNVPLAIAGVAAAWVVLSPTRRAAPRIDWLGAALLTTGLVALNVALLAEARIQSVSGLGELTGDGDGVGGPWLYALAAVAIAGFVAVERRVRDPLVDVRALSGPGMAPAILVNAIVGAGLVIAVVDVPLYVNVVESGIRHSAVVAGAVLTALTAAMALTSYLGGLIAARVGYRPPTLLGLALATGALIVMGTVWDADTGRWTMAAHLTVLGAGVGLVLAPTTAAVVDAAPSERRGVFAGLVLQFRLMGFSVGLAGLTAWGTHRFNELRAGLVLPPLGDPTAATALAEAETRITTSALAETFLGAGAVMAVAIVAALVLPWGPAPGGRGAPDRGPAARGRGGDAPADPQHGEATARRLGPASGSDR